MITRSVRMALCALMFVVPACVSSSSPLLQIGDLRLQSNVLDGTEYRVSNQGGPSPTGWTRLTSSAVAAGAGDVEEVVLVRLSAADGASDELSVSQQGGFAPQLAVGPFGVCEVPSHISYKAGFGIYMWGTEQTPDSSEAVLVAVSVSTELPAHDALGVLSELMAGVSVDGKKLFECSSSDIQAQLVELLLDD